MVPVTIFSLMPADCSGAKIPEITHQNLQDRILSTTLQISLEPLLGCEGGIMGMQIETKCVSQIYSSASLFQPSLSTHFSNSAHLSGRIQLLVSHLSFVQTTK